MLPRHLSVHLALTVSIIAWVKKNVLKIVKITQNIIWNKKMKPMEDVPFAKINSQTV